MASQSTTASTAKPFLVRRANHTGITVSSLSQALAFWHTLIGLPILARSQMRMGPAPNVVGVPDACCNFALLSLPGGHDIELLEYFSPEDRAVYKPRSCDVGSVHVAIEVHGAEGLLEEAKKVGWTCITEGLVKTKRAIGGEWLLAYLRGPDGETVEVMERISD